VVRRRRKQIIVGGLVALIAALIAALFWPSAHARTICWRVHLLGPGPVYRSLAQDEGKWSSIVEGVRGGNSVWLKVAVALRPALDTHPGEEMLEAVTGVIDRNPDGAIRLLIPAYGPDLVCALGADGGPVSAETAQTRLRRIRQDGLDRGADGLACVRSLLAHIRSGPG
jgi:hypothetical protein